MRKEFSDERLLPIGLDGGFGLLVDRGRVRRAVAARAVVMLRGRNPRQCRPGRPWAVVGLDELSEALERKPVVEAYGVLEALAAA